MKSIELESIASYTTKKGISTTQRAGDTNVNMQMLSRQALTLENDLTSIQNTFESATESGINQTESLAMIRVLHKELSGLKRELSNMDVDKGFQATKQAVEGLNGAINAAIGTSSLLGVEHSNLLQIQAKLQAAMTITNGLQTVANTLGKGGEVAGGKLGKIQLILTAAIVAGTWAWDKYTEAERAAIEKRKAHNELEKAAEATSLRAEAAINASTEAIKTFSGTKSEEDALIGNLNERYGTTFGTYDSLAEWYDVLTSKSGKYIEMLYKQQKAQTLIDEAVKVDAEIKEIKANGVESYRPWTGRGGKIDKLVTGNTKQLGSDRGEVAYNKALNEKQAQKEYLLKSAEEYSRDALNIQSKDFTPQQNKRKIKPQFSYNQEEDKTELIRQASEAEVRARQQYDDMVIAAMEEGAEKKQTEAVLNWEREIANISKEQQSRLELNKQIRKKGGTPKQTDETINKDAENKKKLADEAIQKHLKNVEDQPLAEKKAKTEQLLTTYRDAARQRLEIEKKYDADIANLQEERRLAVEKGDTERAQQLNVAMAQAVSKKGQELMGHDLEQLKQDPGYIKAFENLKATSSATLRSLFEQLEEAKQEAEGVLSPAQLKEYTTAMQQVMDELDSRNPFQTLIDRKQELADAQEELANAKRQLDAVNSGAKIIIGVKSSKYNKETGKIESVKSYLSTETALNKVNVAQNKVTESSIKVSKAEKTVNDAINELSTSIKNLGATIGGPAGEIISLIGEIGNFTMAAMSGVGTAAKTSSSAIQAVEKASVILAIVGAAIQIAMKIASIFKEDDGIAAYEDSKKVYESYIGILDKVIEKQKELFNLNSETGQQAYEKAKTTVATQESASRELGKQYLDSGASSGFMGIGSSASHGVSQRKDISSKAWDEAKSALGEDFNAKGIGDGRMTGLFDLSVEQLEQLQSSAPLFWAELHDDTRKYLEQIIACGDSLEEIENDRKAGLTSTDFESFASSFLDVMKDMDSTSQDFADSFESYLQNAILSSLLTNKYKSKIEGLYKNWASYTDSGNELTAAEAESLRQEQEKLAAEMLSDRESLKNSFGWKSESDSSQQSPQSAAFSTMSQEQGTKLEGLFTSVQDHVSGIDTNVADISKSMYEASDSLAVIARNTSYCHHLEQMAQDISELKRDGIKMK